MEKEKALELKQLILNEIDFRMKWREARKQLEDLIDPITEHNLICCDFWTKNLNNVEEMLVIMDNGVSLKLIKPKREPASCESYLPFGIDFTECPVINIENNI